MARTEKSHFWVGRFTSEELYFDFVGEDHSRYELEDYDDVPISKFAASQGEVWIDHDFMESGFEEPQAHIKEQFGHYSYAKNWGTELEQQCAGRIPKNSNVLVFLNENQIAKPQSVEGPDFELIYIGVLEYEI
ncbi:immunity 22 family protein [Spongiimicrobium salis]|uniref:immunity 22 family protein n=1 Tax=Spongiimicrobium salis TaxID=1667022 RepID=UPI00374DAEED